jgi:hypothetical protein
MDIIIPVKKGHLFFGNRPVFRGYAFPKGEMGERFESDFGDMFQQKSWDVTIQEESRDISQNLMGDFSETGLRESPPKKL